MAERDGHAPEPTWAEIDVYTVDWVHGIFGWLSAGIRHDHRSLRPAE